MQDSAAERRHTPATGKVLRQVTKIRQTADFRHSSETDNPYPRE